MVWIPAGQFRMGDSQGQGDSDERPVHQVSINRFAIGRYEVTFAEYDRFADATGLQKPKDNGWGRGNRPVINVSWKEAIAYSHWLSQQTEQQYRLPTEAEWEYMARAGTKTKYWWGNQMDTNQANCMGCGSQWDDKQTAPVGSFAANGFGIHDTIGNVWEWTCSQYKQYGSSKAEQQCDNNAKSSHVIRGGSWSANTWVVRVSSRNSISRYGTDSGVGFRVVRQQ
jgi:formylglycine-generating enzyme required for sulfatase activity